MCIRDRSDILHFGLGDNQEIDSLKIIWPDGTIQTLKKPEVNKLITFEQKNAKPFAAVVSSPVKKLFTYQKPLIAFSHLQLEYNDFKRQPLMPVMLSPCGPSFSVADVNGDGKDDIFFGSSQGQSSELY